MTIPPTASLKGRRVRLPVKGSPSASVWACVLEDPLSGFIKVQQARSVATYWTSRKDILEIDPPVLA